MTIHDHLATGNLDGIMDELRARGAFRFGPAVFSIFESHADRVETPEGAAAFGDEIMQTARHRFAELRKGGRPAHEALNEVVMPYETGRALRAAAEEAMRESAVTASQGDDNQMVPRALAVSITGVTA